ncbi:hypothetical protein N9H39_11310 [Gammaproteobacteria bacterium]|nr:hypothetical protein [Gammaproteobacteria bacterium]
MTRTGRAPATLVLPPARSAGQSDEVIFFVNGSGKKILQDPGRKSHVAASALTGDCDFRF